VELAKRAMAVPELRAAGFEHGPRLMEAAREFWNRWLDAVIEPRE
jgi:hypothetical protein